MSITRKMCVTAAVAAGCAASAGASITYTGGIHTENFNSLASSGTVTSPFTATGLQAPIPGMPAGSAFDGARIAGTSTGTMSFLVSDGTSNAGALFSYGNGSNTDRALGALASGTNIAGFGAEFVNGGSLAINGFTLTFNQEQYRSHNGAGAVPNIFAFAFGTTASVPGVTSANYLTIAGFTADTAGDLVSTGSTGAAVVTFDPPETTARSVTVTGILVQPGESIFIRWSDANETGSDAGVGIDDVSFTGSFVPAPGALALLGLGGLVAARRRR